MADPSRSTPARLRSFTTRDYAALAGFRARLRDFLAFTERAARAAGLTPRQHQLLLAIRGREEPDAPTVGALARALGLRHHTVVGLVDRCSAAGLVRRLPDPEDHRRVHVDLTRRGERALERLTGRHRAELEALRRALDVALLARRRDAGRG